MDGADSLAAATSQHSIIAQTCIVVPLSLLATVLRFLARRLSKVDLWWDDYLLLASSIFNIVFTIVSGLVISFGLGKHIQALPTTSVQRFLTTYYAGQIIYTLCIATVKCSILALYWRIFNHVKSIRIPLYSLAGFVAAWFVTTTFGCLFACQPIEYAWGDMHVPGGKCMNKKAFFLAMAVINSFTDLCLLALPLYYISRLQIRRTAKYLLFVAFLLGGLVCIITFVRIGVLVGTDFNAIDQTWIQVTFAEWTNVEVNVAIISACLPVLRPLLPQSKSTDSITGLSPGRSGDGVSQGTTFGSTPRKNSAATRGSQHTASIDYGSNTVELEQMWAHRDVGLGTIRDQIEMLSQGSDSLHRVSGV